MDQEDDEEDYYSEDDYSDEDEDEVNDTSWKVRICSL